MADVGQQSASKGTSNDNDVQVVAGSRRDESRMDYDVADDEWND